MCLSLQLLSGSTATKFAGQGAVIIGMFEILQLREATTCKTSVLIAHTYTYQVLAVLAQSLHSTGGRDIASIGF